MQPLALYIHIPYCLEKCPYCDFHSVATPKSAIPEENYARILIRQLEQFIPPQRELISIYFGGGTPSLMSPLFFERVLSAAAKHFLLRNPEVTVETNPATAGRKNFKRWRELGINRVSFGTQSFQTALLKKLGRSHVVQDGLRAVRQAQAAGLANVNCDLIFGIEGQTLKMLEADLRTVLDLKIPHVSAYQLTVEPNTPLAHWVQTGRTVLPAEKLLLPMHRLVSKRLEGAGLRRYEISNYARPGFESVHNLQYWRSGDYLGLGSGAVSKIGGRRWKTTRKLKAYLEENFTPEEEEILDAKTAWKEKWMMGLRLTEGLPLDEKENGWEEFFADWETEGWAQRENGRIRLTDKGFMLASRLTQNVFEFINRVC
ncbi:MAG: radical SAM family heme chaperone HemW [Deltaproteobacteria bacterium]|nr:radical SAM family heme chaperone HemW [Deltaproteobacteria bacterium]MBI4224083.1 radical SAM family heme chaperone HemW [Deltaproteobacteria bacterium]